jgi:hypothetical protein
LWREIWQLDRFQDGCGGTSGSWVMDVVCRRPNSCEALVLAFYLSIQGAFFCLWYGYILLYIILGYEKKSKKAIFNIYYYIIIVVYKIRKNSSEKSIED